MFMLCWDVDAVVRTILLKTTEGYPVIFLLIYVMAHHYFFLSFKYKIKWGNNVP